MDNAYNWYSSLIKPSWAPPSWLFGPVWTILYLIIAVSFGFVFYKVIKNKLPIFTALPFLLNLLFNFAFTPLQFVLKNNLLASFDILLVLFTLIWFMLAIYKSARWVMYVNLPYLLWVSFASVLQITITYLNW